MHELFYLSVNLGFQQILYENNNLLKYFWKLNENFELFFLNNKKQFDFLFPIFTQKGGNVRYEKNCELSPPTPLAQSIEYAAGSQFG